MIINSINSLKILPKSIFAIVDEIGKLSEIGLYQSQAYFERLIYEKLDGLSYYYNFTFNPHFNIFDRIIICVDEYKNKWKIDFRNLFNVKARMC